MATKLAPKRDAYEIGASYADENSASLRSDSAPQIGGLEILKVVREYVPLRSGGTATFGETVDKYLTDCAKECVEIQEVKLMFSPEQWHAAADAYRKAEIANY